MSRDVRPIPPPPKAQASEEVALCALARLIVAMAGSGDVCERATLREAYAKSWNGDNTIPPPRRVAEIIPTGGRQLRRRVQQYESAMRGHRWDPRPRSSSNGKRSSEQLYRHLCGLERRGLIRRDDNLVRIIDRAGLIAFATGGDRVEA